MIYTSAAFLDNNNITDSSARTFKLKGQDIALKRWADTSIIKSNSVLKNLLIENGGNTVSGWYNESYEGIIVVTRVYVLELENLTTNYTKVHPYLSYNLTERNALARNLQFVPDNKFTLIPAGQFGIGLEVRFPQINLGGQKHQVILNAPAYPFDIRGSVYDTK